MKKILFVVLIFTGVVCNAQTGLVLRGQSITNSQDSVTYSTFYTIPQFCSGYNRTFQLVFPLYRSAYAAKYLPSQVLNFTGLPVLQNTIIFISCCYWIQLIYITKDLVKYQFLNDNSPTF